MREKDVNLPCRIFAILVMLFLLAPLVVIVIASFTPTALITFPPQGFSLKWYANIFGSSTHFMDGLVNSLKIGILATAADILLGVTAALSVCRYSFKGKDALLNYYTSPMYVPSVAFAFVLLQVYSQIGGVSGMLRIFIGHLIIILPYIVRNTVSVLHVFNWTLEDAATSMGATPIQVFFKITLPLLTPTIFFNLVMQMINGFLAFTQCYIITQGKPMNSTLLYTVYMYQQSFEFYNTGYGAAMAWVMLLMIGLITLFLFATKRFWVYEGGL